MMLLLPGYRGYSQPGSNDSIRLLYEACTSNECKLHQALMLIENWMEMDNLDSAQKWANTMFSILPGDKRDVSHYYYNSRQSEIYYYNNLHRLGLQNAERGLHIARQLNDSIFTADAYNFKGLFLMNLQRLDEAIKSFKSGLQWAIKRNHPTQYLAVSHRYHILGNLSEALYKNNQPTAALPYAYQSLQEAIKASKPRAIAVANNQIGACYQAMGQADSALHYFESTAKAGVDNADVLLLNQASLGIHYQQAGQAALANQAFQKGLEMLRQYPEINSYFSIEFLNNAIGYFTSSKQEKPLQQSTFRKIQILEKGQQQYNVQINEVMDAALKNETRILNLHIADDDKKVKLNRYKIIILSTLLVSVLLMFLLYRNRLLKKLELAKLQNNIQQDLHDDLGGSLSIIRILSDLIGSKKLPPQEVDNLSKKISSTANEAAQKMNTLIWALNVENDTVASFCEYSRQFAISFFEGSEVVPHFEQQIANETTRINGTIRKNLFLCFKELLHNTIKHAQASDIFIRFQMDTQQQFSIVVADNGRGMMATNRFGNGLKNIEKRMEAIAGKVAYHQQRGTTATLSCSL